MRLVLIGAGNLATNIGKALKEAGHSIEQVYSRTARSAQVLSDALQCGYTNRLDDVCTDAEAYIVSVKDSALEQVIAQVAVKREDKVFLHTAGSMPMDCFRGRIKNYGVLYPMQTFSKDRDVCFREIPCFIEANNEASHAVIKALAASISDCVIEMSSSDRRYLHLAAVWACNFVNHCYDIASVVLEKNGIPFSLMLPLIDETARKIHVLSPQQSQTGPAVRYDKNVINKHLALMDELPLAQSLYESLSESIHQRANKK